MAAQGASARLTAADAVTKPRAAPTAGRGVQLGMFVAEVFTNSPDAVEAVKASAGSAGKTAVSEVALPPPHAIPQALGSASSSSLFPARITPRGSAARRS